MNRTVAITEPVCMTISRVTCKEERFTITFTRSLNEKYAKLLTWVRTNSIVSDTFFKTLNKSPCACSSVSSWMEVKYICLEKTFIRDETYMINTIQLTLTSTWKDNEPFSAISRWRILSRRYGIEQDFFLNFAMQEINKKYKILTWADVFVPSHPPSIHSYDTFVEVCLQIIIKLESFGFPTQYWNR